MRISDYLSPDFVVGRLTARDADGVLREVSDRAAAAGIGQADLIHARLLERERQQSTVLGPGLAIPHATVAGLAKPVIGIALAEEPVGFGPPEVEAVSVFLVLLSPPGHERAHIKLLARICRLGRDKTFIPTLIAAEGDQAIVDALGTLDAHYS
ncbi:MAG: PTS sugar transporter subunit IIA [Gemmatimonadetes bacterium]|nr:PTS sugar transporter subunit IIA [Gemmatimonadota bacterium]MDA1103580.1 PTS sugar transporter subunit IIA [Gemmatimonadota bacterium]